LELTFERADTIDKRNLEFLQEIPCAIFGESVDSEEAAREILFDMRYVVVKSFTFTKLKPSYVRGD